MFKVGDKVWDEKSDLPGVIADITHSHGERQATVIHVLHTGARESVQRGECWLQHIADYLREEEALLAQKRRQLDAIRQWADEVTNANT